MKNFAIFSGSVFPKQTFYRIFFFCLNIERETHEMSLQIKVLPVNNENFVVAFVFLLSISYFMEMEGRRKWVLYFWNILFSSIHAGAGG